MEFNIFLLRNIRLGIPTVLLYRFANKIYNSQYSTSTDAYIECLTLEESCKKETTFMNYFLTNFIRTLPQEERVHLNSVVKKSSLENNNITEIVKVIERCLGNECDFPSSKIDFLLVYYAKNGNCNGIKAVQTILEKYNSPHFKLHSKFIHYQAKSLWVNKKTEDSINLFSDAYDNKIIQSKVKVMMICLFPDIIIHESKATLDKTIYLIEHFAGNKQDLVILAYLWKELFQSTWFSDQQLAEDILKRNLGLLILIQWMIPAIGKHFLIAHKVEDFYRLIEFSLQHNLKRYTETLLRQLFDYFCCQQKIQRCSTVVKYASELNYSLTEVQHSRYINLLLKGKHGVPSKPYINTSQPPKLKF